MFGALGPLPVAAAVGVWAIAGLGMGLSYSPISVTVLALAEVGREGRASSSLQLTDVLGVALGTGLGGAFVALGDTRDWPTRSALELAFAATLSAPVIRLPAARPSPRTPPHQTAST